MLMECIASINMYISNLKAFMEVLFNFLRMYIFVVHFKRFWLTNADSEIIPIESSSPKHMQNPILFVFYIFKKKKLIIMF